MAVRAPAFDTAGSFIAADMPGTKAITLANASPSEPCDRNRRRLRSFICPPSKPVDSRYLVRRDGDGGSSGWTWGILCCCERDAGSEPGGDRSLAPAGAAAQVD